MLAWVVVKIPSHAPNAGRRMKILHLEHDPTDAGMFLAWLREAGFHDIEVTTVPSFESVLVLCAAGGFDIVIVNVKGADGPGVENHVEHLRRVFRGPVIALAAPTATGALPVIARPRVEVVDKEALLFNGADPAHQPLKQVMQSALAE